MTEAFITNFRNMILLIGKAGSEHSDCPVNSQLLSKLIDFMFGNPERYPKILEKFRENRTKINEKYIEGTSGSNLDPLPTDYKQALERRDRSFFNFIDLFPKWVREQYQEQIQWYCSFLVNRMEEKHMNFIWKYIEKLDKQAGPL